MTRLATRDAYGALTEPNTIRIERLLPGPVDRVWAYLTDSEKRRQWLAAGEMELRVGAPFELVWRNDELSSRKEPKVNDFPDEQRMHSRITEVDPPYRLSFTWEGSGDVTMELTPLGDEVLLTVTHRSLPDRDTLIMVAAGWHMHLDTLADRAAGAEPQPFWSGWRRLREEYDARLPA
ncbi:SRPBCC family protein [Mesorhizobium sp. ZMM04-5]|uniref:SRPBCC family protein n=1 Tax=Mesorhizobium marinum TaxID=3228790 RepID=A0ABV3R0Z0_9HYPH